MAAAIGHAYRVAVYWAPRPDTTLGRLGNAWLGRDPATGRPLERPALPGAPALAPLTVSPARYGFHATLKPPFRLTGTPGAFVAAVARLAGRTAPGRLAGLRPEVLGGGFLALRPVGPEDGAARVAAAAVTGLDAFRAAPDPAERALRGIPGLTPRQRCLLQEWGYPFVLDEFGFHLTLSDAIGAERAAALSRAYAPLLDPLRCQPVLIDALALFVEPSQGAPFRLVARIPLGG